jgi:hypothetical protein
MEALQRLIEALMAIAAPAQESMSFAVTCAAPAADA